MSFTFSTDKRNSNIKENVTQRKRKNENNGTASKKQTTDEKVEKSVLLKKLKQKRYRDRKKSEAGRKSFLNRV